MSFGRDNTEKSTTVEDIAYEITSLSSWIDHAESKLKRLKADKNMFELAPRAMITDSWNRNGVDPRLSTLEFTEEAQKRMDRYYKKMLREQIEVAKHQLTLLTRRISKVA